MMICVIAAMQLAAPPGVGVKEIGPAAYLDCPRTSVIRRLDAFAKMQIIVRRGARYYLNELLWQRRTNLWRRVTNPALAAKRLTSRQSNVKTVKGPDETDAVSRRLKSLRGGCGLSQTALGTERKVIN